MNTEMHKTNPAKLTGKRYSSVEELMGKEGVSEEVKLKFQEIKKSTEIAHKLALLRHMAGLTQQQMADKLECSQSAISKLECSQDENVTIGQISAYAKETSQRLSIRFGKPLNNVEAIKYHAFKMKERFDTLAKIAREHEDIGPDIQAFFAEAFFNILNILAKSQGAMPPTDACKFEISLQLFENSAREGDSRSCVRGCDDTASIKAV